MELMQTPVPTETADVSDFQRELRRFAKNQCVVLQKRGRIFS